ncbi:MAG TPA: hypothetical protein VF244_03600 [Acidimicrobiales bacterium]
MRLSRGFVLVAVVVAVGLAGCGDDGDDDGVAADSATEAAACSPVGDDIKATATRTVPITLQDFSFAPSTVTVAPGVVSFAATNAGTENHELAFLPGGGEVPLTSAGAPDEDALGAQGAFELEAFGPGTDCSATYDLQPGTYTLFCIVTSADGKTHYEKGMRGVLTVA